MAGARTFGADALGLDGFVVSIEAELATATGLFTPADAASLSVKAGHDVQMSADASGIAGARRLYAGRQGGPLDVAVESANPTTDLFLFLFDQRLQRVIFREAARLRHKLLDTVKIPLVLLGGRLSSGLPGSRHA